MSPRRGAAWINSRGRDAIRAERDEPDRRAKPEGRLTSHERAKRTKWLGVRDDFRNWLTRAA
jgi:hypothetical protein